MSKIRSLPRFCIALSAAVLLTGGLASANDNNLPNRWNHSNLHSGFFAELSSLSIFQALAEHLRKEQEKIAERERSREDLWLLHEERVDWDTQF